MRLLARIVTGRRTKWLVLIAWVILLAVLAPVGQKLSDVTDNRTESFLPPKAESTDALRVEESRFPGGQTVSGLIVYRRAGGLTPQDRETIAADSAAAAKALPLVGKPSDPVASPGGEVAYVAVALPDDNDKVAGWGKDLRRAVHSGQRDGLEVYVTGGLGFNADFEEVFGNIDVKVLGVTVVLVVVLLLLIYRAPLIALVPLLVVGFAYSIAEGFVYLYAKSGATVSDNGATILVVLMFGVGTDYCLLLVSRYREELRRLEDKHEAMQRAVRRAGPAILASGLTVTLAMLVLVLAESGNTKSLGPVAAISVFCAMLAGITVLPAVLTIFGRRGFWPRRNIVEYDPAHAEVVHSGLWRRFGDRVLHRPGPALAVTAGVFVLGALGLIAYKVDYSSTTFFKKSVESVEGFEVLSADFPAGTLSPTTVLVEQEGGPVTDQDVALAAAKLKAVKGVAGVLPTQQVSTN